MELYFLMWNPGNIYSFEGEVYKRIATPYLLSRVNLKRNSLNVTRNPKLLDSRNGIRDLTQI